MALSDELGFDYWKRRWKDLLTKPPDECETLKLMTRFCPVCQGWKLWDYFEDGGKLWGLCLGCMNTVQRMQKCYIANMLGNPIHQEEQILFEDPRFQELAQDRIVDIGYAPRNPATVPVRRSKKPLRRWQPND